jgi:thiamine kinase-like enzyme
LSNEVYENEGLIYKKLVNSKFKEIMSANEKKVIENYDSELELKNVQDDTLIMNKVSGEPLMLYTDEQLINIANEIKRFHKTEIDNKTITPFEEAYKFLGGTNDISKVIEILNRSPILLHNDLVEGNILIDGDKVNLIDFEYS